MLFLQGGDERTAESRREGERAVRAAAAQRADPQLPLTLYNLAMVTDNEVEARTLLDELLASKTHYRDAWYVYRQRGAHYWQQAQEAEQTQSASAARPLYVEAASFYTRAIRRRPHFKVIVRRWSLDIYSYSTPPMLYANAADGHRHAGHAVRSNWYSWRAERRRSRLLDAAHRAMKRGDWSRAILPLELVAIVRQDMTRTVARTWRAVALHQVGEVEAAERLWQEAFSEDPGALTWRAVFVLDAAYGLSEDDLPGDEPTSVEEVNALIEKLMPSEQEA